jgi:hypothetical protein
LLRARELDTAAVVRYYHGLGATAVELTDGFIGDDEVAELQALLGESPATTCSTTLSTPIQPRGTTR